MHVIKKIVISFSFVMQGLSFGAQVCSSIPQEITLICNDERRIARVPVALLVNNFEFFRAYFARWRQVSDTEMRIQASAEDVYCLLASVRNFSVSDDAALLVNEPRSAVSLLVLADQFLLKKEAMDCLKEQYGDAVHKELYSHSSYEKFLQGDREALLGAWAVDKKYTPPPFSKFKLKYSTARFEKHLRDLQRKREQQGAARKEEYRRMTYEIEEKRRKREHQVEEEKRRLLNTILSLPYSRVFYHPEPYVSTYSPPSYNQEDSHERYRAQQEEAVEDTVFSKRVKPTVFSKDKTRSVGFSDTSIYAYDDAEHLLLECSFSLGKCYEGYTIGQVIFHGSNELIVRFKKKVADYEMYIHDQTISLPSYESTDEERYLYHALRSKVKDVGHKLDRLSLSSLEHEAMFDRLPCKFRSEILTSNGRVERAFAKRVETIYKNMKQYSENKCRELQVYKPA